MPEDRCIDCEFGKGVIKLCECPVCRRAMICGDVFTREIYCPNGCGPLPFAVDFCAQKNCEADVYDKGLHFRQYRITISGRLDTGNIKVISGYFKESAARLFLLAKQDHTLTGCTDIFDALSLSEYLDAQSIEYEVRPPLPIVGKLRECWGIKI